MQSASGVTTNALTDSSVISQALASAPALVTKFPTTDNSLALQLQQVAKLLQIRSTFGLTRQIFFCSLGGFDTHSNQIATQNSLYSQLGPAVAAFYRRLRSWASTNRSRRSLFRISVELSNKLPVAGQTMRGAVCN